MRNFLAVLALIALASPAVGQGFYLAPEGGQHPMGPNHWYDRDCCSNRDCQPIPEEAVSITGQGVWHVRFVNLFGTLVDADVDRARVRVSRDGQFHACSTEAGTLICFYIPLSG